MSMHKVNIPVKILVGGYTSTGTLDGEAYGFSRVVVTSSSEVRVVDAIGYIRFLAPKFGLGVNRDWAEAEEGEDGWLTSFALWGSQESRDKFSAHLNAAQNVV